MKIIIAVHQGHIPPVKIMNATFVEERLYVTVI
jgi:hypothetical protein